MITRRSFLGGGAALAAGMAPGLRAWGAKEAAEGLPFLPPCYKDYLPAVAARINARAKLSTDGFWFLSDIHLPANSGRSGAVIAHLAKSVPLDKAFFGGDLPYAYLVDKGKTCEETIAANLATYEKGWLRPVRRAGLKMFTAKGNHDFTICKDRTFSSGYTASGLQAREWLMGRFNVDAGVVTNPDDPEACYFLYDNEKARIRYVVVDTTDDVSKTTQVFGVLSGMRDRQLAWIAERALMTAKPGWGLVFVHHVPVATIVGTESESKTYAPFRQLLEAYQNRGKATVGGKTYDFSAAQGRILLSISGHHHSERQTFQKGILHVTEPCDYRDISYALGNERWCGDLPEKKDWSIYEQTFDAVQLNPEKDLAFFTRVGGGSDRAIHLRPKTLAVGQTLRLKTEFVTGDVVWGCHDADRVTRLPNPKSKYCPIIGYFDDCAKIAPDGTLTATKPGEILAIARDGAFNKEIFPITVV